jgi:hypothetical protein
VCHLDESIGAADALYRFFSCSGVLSWRMICRVVCLVRFMVDSLSSLAGYRLLLILDEVLGSRSTGEEPSEFLSEVYPFSIMGRAVPSLLSRLAQEPETLPERLEQFAVLGHCLP